jgi:hypothetical protein
MRSRKPLGWLLDAVDAVDVRVGSDARSTGVRRDWLRGAVDLDEFAVGIEEEELGVTGRAVAADKNTGRVVLRLVFAKTAGSHRGEGAVEIISAEAKMAIVVIDVAGPEGAGRMNGQMQLQGAAGEPGANRLEGRPFDDCEAEQLLIEGERPREIGGDDIKCGGAQAGSWATIITLRLGKATRRCRLGG